MQVTQERTGGRLAVRVKRDGQRGRGGEGRVGEGRGGEGRTEGEGREGRQGQDRCGTADVIGAGDHKLDVGCGGRLVISPRQAQKDVFCLWTIQEAMNLVWLRRSPLGKNNTRNISFTY